MTNGRRAGGSVRKFDRCSLLVKALLISLLTISCSALRAQESIVDHWETVVYDSSVWKYFPGTSDPGAGWALPGFDDSAWPIGRGSVGYGDGDDRTIINPALSVFLRKKFTIVNTTDIASVLLHVDYDDGFVAYLNGQEIARANMGNGIPAWDQTTPTDHEALLYQGLVPDLFLVDNELLMQGENIITIEVHNVNITSSDLTSALFLSLGLTDKTRSYGPTPAWFVPPTSLSVESSNLPVIVINTNFTNINNYSKITARMGVVNNPSPQRNGFKDAFNNYNGQISIEIHGESSQMFPKKSYRIETQNAAGSNLNVSLLGMPAENDWILYAPYSDKSLLRNMIAYNLGRKLGRYYAPRAVFAELFLNNEYQGVYMLIEKIKVDKNRVNITKLKTTDVTGDDLTGGYLLRVDKIDQGDYPAWTPVPTPALPNENYVTFQFFDPKGEDLVTQQRTYIQNFIQKFESVLSSTTYTDSTSGYHHYLNENSFIDYMLIEEMAKNVDAYEYSTYLYKNKDSKNGRLSMGPLWDFDLGFGNVNYNTNSQQAPGWTWNDDDKMFWFRRLVTSAAFADSLRCRWLNVRKTVLSTTAIMSTIDSAAAVLQESQVRNFGQWSVLGQYVWPNQFVGATWQSEIAFLKSWITDRLVWMDAFMPGVCGNEAITGLEPPKETAAAIYPNPTDGAFNIAFKEQPPRDTRLIIYSSFGELITTKEVTVAQELTWESAANNVRLSTPGFYYVEIRTKGQVIFRSKLIKL